MFETKKLTREIIEQRRAERKPIKRKNRRKAIKMRFCKVCGQPKHNICLSHNTQINKPLWKRFLSKPRYHSRKFFFSLARRLGVID